MTTESQSTPKHHDQPKNHGHRFTRDEARAAGKKGGAKVSSDREHMARIGKRGGTTTARDPKHMSEIGKVGGALGAAKRWCKDGQSGT